MSSEKSRREMLKNIALFGASMMMPTTLACSNSQQENSVMNPNEKNNQNTKPTPTSSGEKNMNDGKKSNEAPILFLAHGAPMLLDDTMWVNELAKLAKDLDQQYSRPKAIVMLSAHWESTPVAVGATKPLRLIYDFYGFPEKYYQLQYKAAGAPEAAAMIHEILRAKNIKTVDAPSRGLDHGTYVPLMCMYPDADIPVLQVSLPSNDASVLFAMGQALAPLAKAGFMVVGSGFITHNMRAFGRGTPTWAKEFDLWAQEALLAATQNPEMVLSYRKTAPAVDIALPTQEHFSPVVVAAGMASALGKPAPSFPITGFWDSVGASAFTRRSVLWG